MTKYTNDQLASIFNGLHMCEEINKCHISNVDALRILKEIFCMVGFLKHKKDLSEDEKWLRETLNENPGSILVHPDNIRYACNILKQNVPCWFAEKWSHEFNPNGKKEGSYQSIDNQISIEA